MPMLSTLIASVLCGMSVRSINQAKINPKGTETAIVMAAKSARSST